VKTDPRSLPEARSDVGQGPAPRNARAAIVRAYIYAGLGILGPLVAAYEDLLLAVDQEVAGDPLQLSTRLRDVARQSGRDAMRAGRCLLKADRELLKTIPRKDTQGETGA
jgi:hypothetical protein